MTESLTFHNKPNHKTQTDGLDQKTKPNSMFYTRNTIKPKRNSQDKN